MDTRIRRVAPRVARAWLAAGLLTLPAAAAAQPAEVAPTLDQAVHRALERNLDVRVERLAPQGVNFTPASIRALYHPTLTGTFGQRSQVNLPSTQLNGGQRGTNDTLTYKVATEVTTAALQMQSAVRQIETATAARSLAKRRLDAEESKFEVGRSTNFFVVQAQRDLQDARNRELRALIDYQKQLVDFERVQETSLQRSGIDLAAGNQAP